MRTIALLVVSNLFMTVAWYGHLKFKSKALWRCAVSWLIALLELLLQVPANRLGHVQFTAANQDDAGGDTLVGVLGFPSPTRRTAKGTMSWGFDDHRGVFVQAVEGRAGSLGGSVDLVTMGARSQR